MGRVKHARRSPAIAVGVLVLIAAVAGTAVAGGPDANSSASTKKTAEKALAKAKKALKKAKQVEKQEGPKGDTGSQGPKGDKGDPATRLFAYVLDDGTLLYGQGATDADSGNTGDYTITFNQSLVGCAAVGAPGFGDPADTGGGSVASATVTVFPNLAGSADPNELLVNTFENDGTSSKVDTNFFLAVFC